MKRIYLILILILLSGCTSFHTPEIRGKVTDAETGKPIADARIYAKWQKTVSGPGGQTGGGIAKELRLKTDNDGSFVIPAYTMINLIPYPFGQGGSFYMIVYAHEYMFKRFTFFKKRDIERSRYKEFKNYNSQIIMGLTELKHPKDWLDNFSEIPESEKTDKEYIDKEYHFFVERFGKKRWDKNSQFFLAQAYERLNDYESAIRKYKELIEDHPEDSKYYQKTLEEYKNKLKKIKEKGRD